MDKAYIHLKYSHYLLKKCQVTILLFYEKFKNNWNIIVY
jgi:hypothetical protein